jgi:hypothetical protein
MLGVGEGIKKSVNSKPKGITRVLASHFPLGTVSQKKTSIHQFEISSWEVPTKPSYLRIYGAM